MGKQMNAHIEMIDRAARELAVGDKGSALEMAERLCLPHYLEGLPEERLAHAFGSGLVARILGNAKECGNLYLNGTGPDEMLNAFQVLVEQTPLVRFGYSAANEALLSSKIQKFFISLILVSGGAASGTSFLRSWPSANILSVCD
jgi:hypothetical protein